MAGLHPNPHINCPTPIIFGESASPTKAIPNTKIAHEIRIASRRPQLSAMYGITKKPINEPA